MIDQQKCLKNLERMSRKKFESVCIELLESMGFDLSDIKSISGDILAEGNVKRGAEGKEEHYVVKCTRSGDDIEVDVEGMKKMISPRDSALLLTTNRIETELYDEYENIEVAGGDKFYELLKRFDLLSRIEPEDDLLKIESTLIRDGDEYLYEGDIDTALEYYDRAISEESQPALAFFKKGKIFFEKNSLEEAKEAFQDSLDLDPENPAAWACLGDIYEKTGELEKAIETYDKALDYDEDHLEAWRGKGKALFDREMYDEAVLCFERILEIEPKDEEAWNSKGLCHYSKEEFKDALDSINSALSISPEFEDALLNKALIFEKLDKVQQALRVAEKLVDLYPKTAEYHYIKGAYLEQMEEHEKAWQEIQRCLQLDPNHQRAQELQFVLQERLGKYYSESTIAEEGKQRISSREVEEKIEGRRSIEDILSIRSKGDGRFEIEIDDKKELVEQLKEEKENLERILEKKEEEIEFLSDELERTKKKLEKKEEEIEERITDKSRKVEELSNRENELKEDLEEKDEKIGELEEEKFELERKVKAMKKDAVETKDIEEDIKEKEESIDQLVGERENLKSRLDKSEDEIEELRDEKSALKDELEALKGRIGTDEDLYEKLEKKDETIELLKEKLEKKEEELQELREETPKTQKTKTVYGHGRKMNEALLLWKMDENEKAIERAPKVEDEKALNVIGVSFYDKNDVDSAKQMFEDALPSKEAKTNLEELHFMLENYREAYETVKGTSLERFLGYWEKCGETLRRAKRFDEAVRHYEMGERLETDPLVDFVMAKARCEVEREGLEEGIKALDQVENKVMYPEILNLIGAFCYEGRGYERSYEFFDVCKRLEKNSVHLNNLGCSAARREMFEEASKHFENALELDPNNTKIMNNLGFCQLERNLVEKARDTFDKALNIDESDPVSWYNKGIALKRSGEEGWREAVERSLELEPGFEEAKMMLEG